MVVLGSKDESFVGKVLRGKAHDAAARYLAAEAVVAAKAEVQQEITAVHAAIDQALAVVEEAKQKRETVLRQVGSDLASEWDAPTALFTADCKNLANIAAILTQAKETHELAPLETAKAHAKELNEGKDKILDALHAVGAVVAPEQVLVPTSALAPVKEKVAVDRAPGDSVSVWEAAGSMNGDVREVPPVPTEVPTSTVVAAGGVQTGGGEKAAVDVWRDAALIGTDGGGPAASGEGDDAGDPRDVWAMTSHGFPGPSKRPSDFNTLSTRLFNHRGNTLSWLLFMGAVALLCVALSMPTFGLPLWVMPVAVALVAGVVPMMIHRFTGVFTQADKLDPFTQVDSRKRWLLLLTGMLFAAALSLLVVPAAPAALMIPALQWQIMAAMAFALYVPALGSLWKTVLYEGPQPGDKGYTRWKYWAKVVGVSLLMVPALMFAFPTTMLWLAAKVGLALPSVASANLYMQTLAIGAGITAGVMTAAQSFGALSRAVSTVFAKSPRTRAFFDAVGAFINFFLPFGAIRLLAVGVTMKLPSLVTYVASALATSVGWGVVGASAANEPTGDERPVPLVRQPTVIDDGGVGSPTQRSPGINEADDEVLLKSIPMADQR